VSLSFDLHGDLADEHGGAEQWGYRRIRCGKLTARDRSLPKVEDASSWEKIVSWIPLGKRKFMKKEAEPSSTLPNDLDWFLPKCIESYEDISTSSATAQVNPYQFTHAMAKLAEEAGAKVTIGSVDKIDYDEEKVEDSIQQPTGDGADDSLGTASQTRNKKVQSVTYTDKATSQSHTIPATVIVLAAGPWTPVVFPPAPVSTLRAHSVTIRHTRPISAYCLFTEISVPLEETDDEYVPEKDYSSVPPEMTKIMSPEIYSRPNNEVYVCGTGDNEVPLPANTDEVEVDRGNCQSIVDAVASISDEIRNGIVTSRRACYLPTVDVGGSGGPLIGQTGIEGLLMATGHSCWGINNAPATGKLISEMVFDGDAVSADISALDPRLVM